jgi:GTPase SAR1 family protein
MQAVEFKVTLIGNTNTGKTAFLEKLLYGEERRLGTNMTKTLGVDVKLFEYRLGENKYRINFWDCGGDERFSGLGNGYITGSDLVLIFGSNNVEEDNKYLSYVPEDRYLVRTVYNNDNYLNRLSEEERNLNTMNILRVIRNALH